MAVHREVITKITILDDMDQALPVPVETVATEHCTFSLDGVKGELDLTEQHAKELTAALAIYFEAAERARSVTRPRAPSGTAREAAIQRNRKIKAWANDHPKWRDNKWAAKNWMYVPSDLLIEYDDAHPGEPPVARKNSRKGRLAR